MFQRKFEYEVETMVFGSNIWRAILKCAKLKSCRIWRVKRSIKRKVGKESKSIKSRVIDIALHRERKRNLVHLSGEKKKRSSKEIEKYHGSRSKISAKRDSCRDSDSDSDSSLSCTERGQRRKSDHTRITTTEKTTFDVEKGGTYSKKNCTNISPA